MTVIIYTQNEQSPFNCANAEFPSAGSPRAASRTWRIKL